MAGWHDPVGKLICNHLLLLNNRADFSRTYHHSPLA